MGFDFKRLQPATQSRGPVDPIELFRSLQMGDENVNDLWMGQADALREWNTNRSASDIAVVLNTGAGKTLVGLLMAQSLVNELSEPVVYACASIQLVQQTAAKAASYGVPATTYYSSEFSDTRYQEGATPCITTYQALFNGLTHKWDNARAIVFDDAHAATHIVRDQFTLRLRSEAHQAAYSAVQAALDAHLQQTDSALGFREAIARRDGSKSWLVPPFVVRRCWGTISNALLSERLSEHKKHRYVWGYLSDKIDLCAVFITPNEVSFTPPVVPTRTLPYFDRGVRRVYLSATLAAEDAFLRTFGSAPALTIAPPTPAGQCERMILIPARASGVADDVATAKSLVHPLKALVMVPSRREGEVWADVTPEILGDEVAEQVERFKAAPGPEKLRLIARYDGVDLPGDTCRLMVIHGLPSGLGPLERFMWDTLRIHAVLRSTVASRLVQSFGRISRGMADHGIVLLTGKRLIEWLLTPANKKALPAFLRNQIEAGFQLSGEVDGSQLGGLIQQCLARDPAWREWHGQAVGAPSMVPPPSEHELSVVAKAEADFGALLWERDYTAAATVLYQHREAFHKLGIGLGAWYRMWEGFLYDLLGHGEQATECYRDARRADKAIPCATQEQAPVADVPDARQIQEVARAMLGDPNLLHRLDIETALISGGTHRQAEAAVCALGTFLGLDSSRPDNDQDTGPDVLWFLPGHLAWSLEQKTDKELNSTYFKKEVMQAKDHVDWVVDNVECERALPFIVGPRVAAHRQANPSQSLRVQTPEELVELRLRLRAALENIMHSHIPVTLRAEVHREFQQQGLLWSQLSVSAPGVVLRDIQPVL